MSALPKTFKQDLAETDDLLATAERRLSSLKDFADFEGLPVEVSRRLERKRRVLELTREDLDGIPALVEQAGARR